MSPKKTGKKNSDTNAIKEEEPLKKKMITIKPKEPVENDLNIRIVSISSLCPDLNGNYNCELCCLRFSSTEELHTHKETHLIVKAKRGRPRLSTYSKKNKSECKTNNKETLLKDKGQLGPGLRTYSRKNKLECKTSNPTSEIKAGGTYVSVQNIKPVLKVQENTSEEQNVVNKELLNPKVSICEFCQLMFGSEQDLAKHRNNHFGVLEEPVSVVSSNVEAILASAPPKINKNLVPGIKTYSRNKDSVSAGNETTALSTGEGQSESNVENLFKNSLKESNAITEDESFEILEETDIDIVSEEEDDSQEQSAMDVAVSDDHDASNSEFTSGKRMDDVTETENEKLEFTKSLNLKTQIDVNMLQQDLENSCEETEDTDSKNLPFMCRYCLMTYKTQVGLTNHYYRTHNKKHRANRKYFKCRSCKKFFFTEYLYLRHISTHEVKILQCEICGTTFGNKRDISRHKFKHATESTVHCKPCFLIFHDWKAFVAHFEISHTGETLFFCELCELNFESKEKMEMHNQLHTQSSSFKCPICNKGFNTIRDMRVHALSQNCEMTNRCDLCNVKFKHKYLWKEHMNFNHHKGKSSSCTTCCRTFVDKEAYEEHQNNLHTDNC